MEGDNIRKDLYDICFEFTLKYIKEWQSFSLEDIIVKLQQDKDFMRIAKDNLNFPSLWLNSENVEKFKNQFRDYLVNNELAELVGKDDINRAAYRLTKKGKEAKKFENIYSNQASQERKMINLTLIIAIGTGVAAIYYMTQINDYMNANKFEYKPTVYFILGCLIGLILQSICRLGKRRVVRPQL